MATFVFGIFIGISICAMVMYVYTDVKTQKLIRVAKESIAAAYDMGFKSGTVQPKIDRINEISKEQINCIGALDQPNSNASHARHKNKLITLVKKLEEEKLDILRNILKTGADPIMTVMIGDKVKNLKISELLLLLESNETQERPQPKTDSNIPGDKKTLRLVTDNTKDKNNVYKFKPRNPEVPSPRS